MVKHKKNKSFDMLMGIIEYGSEAEKALLLKALLMEKKKRNMI